MCADVFKQVMSANKEPFCQTCLKLLEQAEPKPESINEEILYPLQLVLWAVENHPQEVPFPHSKNLVEMESLLYGMMDVEPERVLRRLLDPQGEPWLPAKMYAARKFRGLGPLKAALEMAGNVSTWWEESQPALGSD